MKAFKLFQEILSAGLDNSVVTEYKYNKDVSIQDYFGNYSATGKVLEEDDEFIAIWSDEEGKPRIKGVADIILTNSKNDKIYLYCIE